MNLDETRYLNSARADDLWSKIQAEDGITRAVQVIQGIEGGGS